MAIYRCVAKGVFASGRTWSIRQYFTSSSVLATVHADWTSQMASAWTDATHGLETLYPTTTIFNEVLTYAMITLVGPPPKFVASTLAQTAVSHAGTSTNDGLPDQDAVCVSLRTAGVGPNNRGRNKLPAIDETIVVGDIINTTPATRVTTAMTALRTGMAAAGHIHVILNDKPTAHDPVIATTKPVTQCETDRVIRTQRPRVRKEAAQYV